MMSDVIFKIEKNNDALFYIMKDDIKVAWMEVKIAAPLITVLHTEVLKQEEKKGLAKKLFESMVEYAKKFGLQIKPLCPYVLVQLKRNPALYQDVFKA